MSYPSDCIGCAGGHHERHNRSEGWVAGVIGGTCCPCSGDCGVRFAAFAAHLSEVWVASSGETENE